MGNIHPTLEHYSVHIQFTTSVSALSPTKILLAPVLQSISSEGLNWRLRR